MGSSTKKEEARLSLLACVQQICEHVGGRAVAHGLNGRIVRVMDCPMWTVRGAALLRASRPNALVSVESSIGSLSGFVVVISERARPPYAMLRILAATLALMSVLVGSIVLLSGPQEAQLPATVDAGRALLMRWLFAPPRDRLTTTHQPANHHNNNNKEGGGGGKGTCDAVSAQSGGGCPETGRAHGPGTRSGPREKT